VSKEVYTYTWATDGSQVNTVHYWPTRLRRAQCGQQIGPFTLWDRRPFNKRLLGEHRRYHKGVKLCRRCYSKAYSKEAK
jgi:hypothetical protein